MDAEEALAGRPEWLPVLLKEAPNYSDLSVRTTSVSWITRLPPAERSIYTASGLDHVRVEACDSCNTYVKAVDLTKDGLAIPVVDELATVALNIWVDEHGYTKLEFNILGL